MGVGKFRFVLIQVRDGLPAYQNERLQTTVEIYSERGQSEYYDPNHPLSYENCSPSGTSSGGPHYARDAWVAGQRLGVIASSDNHTASPGQPHRGLAAVYAEDLTREAIFDAIAARHTYGTTGQRILLDFKVDGQPNQLPSALGQRVTALQ